MNSWLGLDPFFDFPDLVKLILRFGINFVFATLVIRAVYYRLYGDRGFLFTYYLLNAITFTLCFLLRKVPAELGFALAIFAVFGILRYRTEQIRSRELTYLFVVIGLGVINAVANKTVDLAELLTVNILITGLTVFIEYGPLARRDTWTPLLYDNLDLLKPGRQQELLRDIRERTGLAADRVEIEELDLLRDSATLKVRSRAS
jgi:hypothetical protein